MFPWNNHPLFCLSIKPIRFLYHTPEIIMPKCMYIAAQCMFKECFSSLLGCDCSLYTCEISFCFTKGKIYCLSDYCAVVFRPIDTKGHTHTIVKRYFSRQLRQRMALSSGGNLDRLIAPHIQAKEITLLDLYWFAILFACEIQIALGISERFFANIRFWKSVSLYF